MTTPEELVALAKEARERSYCPYSKYAVGAALLCADGTVYQGCNIENAAFGPTVCAERVAIFKAVYDGHRKFKAIAVAGGRAGEEVTGLFPPCGVCRQVLREFCGLDLMLYMAKENGEFESRTLGEMLPLSFSGADMG
jgi:cytidine deaminase, homotetrameric